MDPMNFNIENLDFDDIDDFDGGLTVPSSTPFTTTNYVAKGKEERAGTYVI